MSEIKEILNSKEPVENTDINSIKSTLEKSDEETKNLKKEISDLKFQNDFNQIAQTYPNAREYGDKIYEKVSKGYSVEDATIAVLGKENKLKTADEIKAEQNKGKDLGGTSAHTSFETKKAETLEELRTAFQEAEARGEIRII